MAEPTDALRLRVLVGDASRAQGQPLFRAVVELLHARGVRGATAYRGSMGFGRHAQVHAVASEHTSLDLPVVVESVDSRDVIEAVLPALRELVRDGLVTTEKVRIVR